MFEDVVIPEPASSCTTPTALADQDEAVVVQDEAGMVQDKADVGLVWFRMKQVWVVW